MRQIKKYAIVIASLLLITGASSCGLFKGKNKCGDCPTWGQNEVPVENQKTVNV